MRSLARVLLLTGFVTCAGAGGAGAQLLPGDHYDVDAARRADRAAIMTEVQRLLASWQQAWVRGDPRAVARLYTKDALLLLPQQPMAAQGTAAIERALAESLGKGSGVQFGLADAETGDPLLYVAGRFEYALPMVAEPGGGVLEEPEVVGGTYLAVLERQGRNWRIRAHIFRADLPQP
mgnify:CR=1 FL=1